MSVSIEIEDNGLSAGRGVDFIFLAVIKGHAV